MPEDRNERDSFNQRGPDKRGSFDERGLNEGDEFDNDDEFDDDDDDFDEDDDQRYGPGEAEHAWSASGYPPAGFPPSPGRRGTGRQIGRAHV